jgi:hypothetical protein
MVTSVARATCTGDASINYNGVSNQIVLHRFKNTGTDQYKIDLCTSGLSDWVTLDTCTSNSSGVLTENVVITGGTKSDLIEIVSGYLETDVPSPFDCPVLYNYTYSWPTNTQTATITVNGGAGADIIHTNVGEFANPVSNQMAWYGNDGNDCLDAYDASYSSNVFVGGDGNDVVIDDAGGDHTVLAGDGYCPGGGYCPGTGTDCVADYGTCDYLSCGPGTDAYDASCGGHADCENQGSCSCSAWWPWQPE